MPIRLERFKCERALSRQIFLDLPKNHKVIRVAGPGETLREDLLSRLPASGVRELYAQTEDGDPEPINPETYPIYLEEMMAMRETWEDSIARFSRELPDAEVRRFSQGNPVLEEITLKAAVAPEPEDRFFPKSTVDEFRELYKPNPETIEAKDEWGRPKRSRREQYSPDREFSFDDMDGLPPYSLRSLNELLMKTLREFAQAGEHFDSSELRVIAAKLVRAAAPFLNSRAPGGVSADCLAEVLAKLVEARVSLRRYALRDGYSGAERLQHTLTDAIRAFRRGVREGKE